MDVDPEYEYNAPQFVDFDLIRKGQEVAFGDGNPDDYFNFDHESGIPVDITPEVPKAANSPKVRAEVKIAVNKDVGKLPEPAPRGQKRQTTSNQAPERSTPAKTQEDKVPSNICTSMDEWQKKTGGAQRSSGGTCEPKPAPRLKRSNSVRVPNMKPVIPSNTQKHTRTRTRSVDLKTKSLSDQLKQRRSTPRSTSANNSVNSSMSSESSMNSSRNRSADKTKDGMPHTKPRLTLPVTPKFMRKMRAGSSTKSTEQLEMDRIKVLKDELKKKKHMAEESLKKSMKSGAYAPVKSAGPVTKPVEFHFTSDSRIKGTKPEPDNKSRRSRDFTSSLRAHPSSPLRPKPSGITRPAPFHFTSEVGRKRKHEDSEPHSEKYESMAETLAKYSTKTPDRFRTKPQNKEPTPSKKRFCSGDKPRLTHPKTPSFQTRARSRSHHVVSQAELDEQEIQEIQSYQFKAHPVNTKILKPDGVVGLKKVEPKAATQIEPFDLETNHRVTRSAANKSADYTKHEFHARPVPKSIQDQPTGVPSAKSLPITVPQSPAFALKNRIRSQVQDLQLEPEEEEHIIRAKPVPHLGIPFQPKVAQQKITMPQPFSFESRDKDTKAKKEKRIKKMLDDEKKAREFHANPIPDHSPTLPPKPEVLITRPEPFELEAEIRGAMKAEEWARKVEDELKQQRDLANFKARPNRVSRAEPFQVRRDPRPLLEVNELELNCERRARERMDYEKWKKEQELEHEAEKIVTEKRKEQEAEEERRRLRVQAVPRAQPIRHYKPVVIHPSDKPVTEPETPRFSDRLRKKVRC